MHQKLLLGSSLSAHSASATWLKTLNATCEADGIEQSSHTKQLVTRTLPWETIEVSKVSITFVWRTKLSATCSGPVVALIAEGFWLV